MTAAKKPPPPTPRELADQHDLRIHRAKQLARPVLYRDKQQFIAGFCWHKGDDDMVVYLAGSADPVKPSEITILEHAQ